MPRKLNRLLSTAALAVCVVGWRPAPASSQETGFPIGIAGLYRIDQLAKFRRSVRIGSFSSYDRTGGNDDGFSGKYSFLRREGDGLLLAELEGPGAIYRIWTPTPTDDRLEFYFDGEATPRIDIKFRELFTGEREPFVRPIVGHGAGGFFSYLPIPFAKSVKVVAKAEKIQFYQINYALYPPGTEISTYSGYSSPTQKKELDKARTFLASVGADTGPSEVVPDATVHVARQAKSLGPGETVTLFETSQPGRIAGLRLGPANVFRDKGRGIVLKIYWDGDSEPAVLSPVGDFFGYAWGEPAVRSSVLGTRDNTNYIYLPMPYDRSARVELTSETTSGPSVEVRSEVYHAGVPRAPEEGKFYALWRRENPTSKGKPFTFLDTKGRGHVVGAILQAQGLESGTTPFFEGDDQATIDGELVIHGTGSEDFFNGGWYNVPGRWMSRVSFPLSGCLGYNNPLSRTGGYRFLLADAYAYDESLLLTIEHAPTENALHTDYAAVTYLYSERRPTVPFSLPPAEKRRVTDLDRIVFRPGWSVPIEAFSFQNLTLAKKQIKLAEKQIRYLSVRAEGRDIFGLHNVMFRCELPAAGKYQVSVEALKGPDQAMIQLFQNEKAEGQAADLYAAERLLGEPMRLGVLEMAAGENEVFFKLVGQNPQSSGLGFDVVTITFEKVQ